MGAKCSLIGKESSYRITFLGVDVFDRLQALNFLALKPGQVAKQVAGIACIIDEISFSQSLFFRGRCPIRTVLPHIYKNTDGLVYVVDSTNEAKLQGDLMSLDKHILKNDETRNLAIMILANKQDEEGTLSLKQIENKVGEILASHDTKLGRRTLFLRGCSAATKVGLDEAFSQFAQIIQLHKGRQITPGLQTFSGDELEAFGKKDNSSRLHTLKKMFDMSYLKSVLLY